jgi:hypothetical protein
MAKSTMVHDGYRLQHDTRNNPLLAWVFEQVEVKEIPLRRMPYQQLLRALGAWLDSSNACNINLIETSTGFMIRYGVGEDTLLLRRFILTHAELEHLEAAMKERRSVNPSGRYQDFLRALGYEIDAQAGAYMVLDEVEDNLFLTFCQPSAGGGLTWIKRARILNTEDQGAILRKAYARRKPPAVRQRFWQRIGHRQPRSARVRELA